MSSKVSSSIFPAPQSKVIMATTAVAGITLLVLGILTHQGILFAQIGQGGAWGLMASGVVIPAAAFVSNVVNRKKLEGGTYKVITWNVGTDGDFCGQKKIAEDSSKGEIKTRRIELMKAVLQTPEFQGADIILLQEAYETFTTEALTELLPGYQVNKGFKLDIMDNVEVDEASNQPIVDHQQCCPIIWRSDRFVQVENAPEEKVGKSSLTVLRDIRTGVTFAVASGYIDGFNMESYKRRGGDGPSGGDAQLREISTQLNGMGTDVALIGMDANTTWEHHPARLTGMGSEVAFDGFLGTTFDDINLRMPVKLDHIGVSTHNRGTIRFTQIPNPQFIGHTKSHTQSPGDHAPVIAEIEINF